MSMKWNLNLFSKKVHLSILLLDFNHRFLYYADINWGK